MNNPTNPASGFVQYAKPPQRWHEAISGHDEAVRYVIRRRNGYTALDALQRVEPAIRDAVIATLAERRPQLVRAMALADHKAIPSASIRHAFTDADDSDLDRLLVEASHMWGNDRVPWSRLIERLHRALEQPPTDRALDQGFWQARAALAAAECDLDLLVALLQAGLVSQANALAAAAKSGQPVHRVFVEVSDYTVTELLKTFLTRRPFLLDDELGWITSHADELAGAYIPDLQWAAVRAAAEYEATKLTLAVNDRLALLRTGSPVLAVFAALTRQPANPYLYLPVVNPDEQQLLRHAVRQHEGGHQVAASLGTEAEATLGTGWMKQWLTQPDLTEAYVRNLVNRCSREPGAEWMSHELYLHIGEMLTGTALDTWCSYGGRGPAQLLVNRLGAAEVLKRLGPHVDPWAWTPVNKRGWAALEGIPAALHAADPQPPGAHLIVQYALGTDKQRLAVADELLRSGFTGSFGELADWITAKLGPPDQSS